MKRECKRPGNVVLPRGVLKVRLGYNPNSSSIGTVVYAFPLLFIALSAVVGVIAALIRRKEPPSP